MGKVILRATRLLAKLGLVLGPPMITAVRPVIGPIQPSNRRTAAVVVSAQV